MASRVPGYEETVTCPYNKCHVILKQRFQTHLIKCKRANPNIQLQICPFDQTHHVREEDMDAHVSQCPARAILDLHVYDVNGVEGRSSPEPKPATSRPVQSSNHEGEEDWDHFDTGTYDPQIYAQNARVIRGTGLSTKSERSKFRDEERKRLSALDHRRDNEPQ